MRGLSEFFIRLLDHPVHVFMVAVTLGLASLLVQGNLTDLWSLLQEKQRLNNKMVELHQHQSDVQAKIRQAKSDRFVGHEARERLGLVAADELVFIFDDTSK